MDLGTTAPMVFANYDIAVQIGDGRKLVLRVAGHGLPTILLTTGIAGARKDWGDFQAKLSELSRTVTYDHAGAGDSTPGPLPRLTSQTVDDLRIALSRAEIEPPFVLVAYSAGAFDALYYAFQWTNEIVGMVLIDPSITHMGEKLHPLSPELSASDHEELAKLRKQLIVLDRDQERSSKAGGDEGYDQLQTRLSELENFFEGSSDEILQLWRSLGNMPLIVFSANKVSIYKEAEHDAVLPIWKSEHHKYARLSDQGICRDLEGGHSVFEHHSDEIFDAIKAVVQYAISPKKS